MSTPTRANRISGRRIPDILNDPAVPYSLISSLQKGNYLKRPLYLYDTKKYEPVLLDGSGASYTLNDYEQFELFRQPIGQGTPPKTVIETNMRTEGVVPESEVWIATQIELQIVNSHNLNIWPHEEIKWALSQGVLILNIDQEEVLEVPANRAFCGAPPYINALSRRDPDTLGSWPDVTNPHNSRMADFGPTTGFTFHDAAIAFRPKVPFKVIFRADKDALGHLAQWVERLFPAGSEHPVFVHDLLKFRVAMRGRRYINTERPL